MQKFNKKYLGEGKESLCEIFKIVGIIKIYLEFDPIENKTLPSPYSFFDPLKLKNSPNNNQKN